MTVATHRDVDQLSEERLNDLRARQRSHFRALVKLITEAQSNDLIASEVNPTLAAHGVLSTLIWPYTWFKPNGRMEARELVTFCVGYITAGLQAYSPITVDGAVTAERLPAGQAHS